MRKNKALIPQYFDFNFVYKFLSNKKLLRILPCQIFSLTLVLQITTSKNNQ